MEKKLKIAFVAAFIIVVAILTTCHYNKPALLPVTDINSSLLLKQLNQSKAEKQKLIEGYEKKITRLQVSSDSLRVNVNDKKRLVTTYQFKEKYLQNQLKHAIIKPDVPQPVRDVFLQLIDSLSQANVQSDTLCNQTISELEKIIANRDSTIDLHTWVEKGQKDLGDLQNLKEQYLTDQLTSSLKALKKKTRHAKIVSGALLILAGITTTLIIIQKTRR